MNLVGKYLRLRRELLDPVSRNNTLHRRRVARDLIRTGTEVEAGQRGEAPFLATMPWSDTDASIYDQPPRPL